MHEENDTTPGCWREDASQVQLIYGYICGCVLESMHEGKRKIIWLLAANVEEVQEPWRHHHWPRESKCNTILFT